MEGALDAPKGSFGLAGRNSGNNNTPFVGKVLPEDYKTLAFEKEYGTRTTTTHC